MSNRSTEGVAAGAETEERRTGAGQRVHFEALVAVGGATGGTGFEAESVDVSPEGMRLRTAYLPDLGDRLVCRFDGMGIEVVTEGEVIWRNDEARGGEFGLRFVGLSGEAAAAVRAMCGSLAGEGEPAEAAEAVVARGTRVRLHIEGLGSPMKARVREAAGKEIEVGSNLEFLRVGRNLEVEDVDQGNRKKASIDHVKVEVDPATNVPQLVVSLRYEGAPEKREAPAPTARATGGRERKGAAAVAAGLGAAAAVAGVGAAPTRSAREAQGGEGSGASSDVAVEDELDDEMSAHPGRFDGVAKAGRRAAGAIAPALTGAGRRARGAMGGILSTLQSTLQRKRAERAEAKRAGAPRRVTAPAPAGGLVSEGRRLVRDEGDGLPEDAAAPPRMNKRAAAIGSLLGLTAVLAVFAVTRFVSARGGPAGTPDTKAVAALPAAAADAPVTGAGTPVVNVPLFGTTPLSTTETVPPPAPSVSASAVAGAPPAPAPASDEEPALAGPGVKEWGPGGVKNPVVLKLKMDGPIEGITGASGAMGFTVSLPNRRALGSAAELAKKDKRLASVNVVNTSHGAEVTVQFKDGVPPYLAKVKGDRLEIALGREGHGKVAKKKGKKKSKK